MRRLRSNDFTDMASKKTQKDIRSSRQVRRTHSASATDQAAAESSLLTELRERLIAEMDASKIPPKSRVSHLAQMTGCVVQTARRWVDEDKSGLPDLASFVKICRSFDSDANYLLGLIPTRFPLPKNRDRAVGPSFPGDTVCQSYLADQANEQMRCEVVRMLGDDMEPRIPNGAPMWVDREITDLQENGVYLLEYQDRVMVRQVEMRIGEGLCLSCDNQRYRPTVVKDAVAAEELGLRVLGRVRMVLHTQML